MGLAILFDYLGVKKEKGIVLWQWRFWKVTFFQIGFLQRVTTNQVPSSNVGEAKSGKHESIDGLAERHQQVTHSVRVTKGTYHTASGTNAV